ncbi:pleckstrin homology domain-containing family A member 7 [Trichonephila clavata]|uniref:Pleckstrin homology domain-containing family A member 7 n=1 Tax=Trichonephila clavata TaxID=2740835 RepID=A0A8X6EZ60_TRICU|nr:pleckstrin homology domain-containing family A member 7 [Trichonephila clavata]
MAPMRRKSQGSIRSPHVKRDSQSQVIIEGWLYKLEGAALKQFKHRWCVLADFCLFFYKGPSEEKVTSSILLPSYKISPCTSEDKISRKFAFKAEHQNMKTYYFAAEDKETMKRWMNAMSLASIMQNFVRSENYETTFSSASNDDEDSGFTSYRSRRYTSQKLNSTYDSNFSAEPLKQRSNSYGDRMGEVYLGSDDKYPNVYKNSASYMYKNPSNNQVEVPRRQPLYANAPPKPRRLTQSDYSFYPKDILDPRDQEIAAIQASQYSYEKPEEKIYSDHQKDMPYHPLDQYMPGSDPALMHAGMQYVDNYPPSAVMEAVPDLYKNQPPRPRSADFLEREVESGAMPDVAMYSQNRQPQRPKSSLEYYDRYVDSEDCNFDYYREAVRIQADNLYANKNLNKHRKHRSMRHTENIVYNDPQNILYTDNNYMINEQVSPCYGSTSKPHISKKYDDSGNACVIPAQNEHYDSKSRHSKPKKSKEESMQRLLEWKQRMLQSPLTKRNHLQSNSSDTSSPMTSPMRSYKSDHQKKVRKELETHEAHYHSSIKQIDYSYPPTSSNPRGISPQGHKDHRRRNDSSSSQKDAQYESSPAPRFSDIDHPKFSPQFPDSNVNRNLNISAENLYKENIMYCVDSENNEILFSYDDSPTTNIPKNLQTCHYPPQMHSFTTMPNVSSIGSENQEHSSYDVNGSSERNHQRRKGSLSKNIKDYKVASNCSSRHRTTYSSDDEDILREHEMKTNSDGIEDRNPDVDVTCEEDNEQPNRYQSSSPDYVNIGAICNESMEDYLQEIEPPKIMPSDCHKINHAVLKPLEQVSKHAKVTSDCQDIDYPLADERISESVAYGDKAEQESFLFGTRDAKDSIQNQSFTSYSSRDGFESETEFDIKREDYYRASQIFYASTRIKNKHSSSKKQKVPKMSTDIYSGNKSQPHNNYANVSISGSISSLDRDIGIPLQITTYNPLLPKKSPDAMRNSEPSQEMCSSFKSKDYEKIEMLASKQEEQLIQPSPSYEHITDNRVSKRDAQTQDYSEKPNECTEVLNKKLEVGKKLSYEEMRGQLLRKREAPPPNIVQDRIKKFETAETDSKSNKKNKTEYALNETSSKEKHSVYGVGKRNRHKASRAKASRRALHSDSEAIAFQDSDDSSDDLTMKSAPILLSPLSCVLADLRKTAESGKEKSPPKNVPSSKKAMKEYFRNLNEACSVDNHADISNHTLKSSQDSSHSTRYAQCYGEIPGNADEAEYLPMFGLKYSDEKEPEYVMMGGSKLSPCKNKKFFIEEEHVYNEPFSPPPSFLHDVYEKQKTKQYQYQMKSSSSEDSLTENIYEKPMHRYPSGSVRNIRSDYLHKSVQETNNVLMSSLSCSNVTAVGRSGELLNERNNYKSERHISSKSSFHHYEQANLSVSVPDLLKLKEMKDSDASDADDEASRDFDTVGSVPLPSYQSPILNQFCENSSNTSQIINLHSSLDSEVLPYNPDSENGEKPHHSFQYDHSSSNDQNSLTKPLKNEIKPLPSYEALYNMPSASHSDPNAQNISKEDSSEKFRVQKLRIYTKGKKPEAPKIFPVPFSLEESEICKILERKDSTKSLKVEDLAFSGIHNLDSSLGVDSDSLSENIAYASRDELPQKSNAQNFLPKVILPSYRPDVVPSVQVDERVPNEKYSPSKSPNSAPYYYSDLYSGQGINFTGQISFKRNDVPYMDKTSPPKSNSALLNNVKSRSPSYSSKGDIGRKVNKINSKPSATEEKDALNEKYWESEGAKINLKCSIDILESSKSKYLDAEKNKYEAGHTLEKTRSNSTMSYFKHRSSTPELNTCQYQSDEPVYENIIFQSKTKLQKRLSQSLEGLPQAPELIDNTPEVDENINRGEIPGNPVYENIDFYNSDRNRLPETASQIQKTEQLSQSYETANKSKRIMTLHNTSAIAEKQFCSAVSSLNEIEFSVNAPNPIDNETDFLDQNVLRRVSEQHFFGKNFKPQYLPKYQHSSVESKNSLLNYSAPQKFSLNSATNDNKMNDNQKQHQESLPTKLNEDSKNKLYDSDSTSGATSSCDEASLDSDNKHQNLNIKMRSIEMPRSSSEIHIREPNHLRKLVQQSEGLMCKGKRLSVSAGDLLGKTHEELVLLLIQLRRNQTKILRAKEKLEQQIENLQEFPQSNTGRQPAFQNKKDLLKQIQLLEKQYDITQPLVNLVDNMVKLGSLYGSSNRRSFSLPVLDTSQEDVSTSAKSPQSPDHIGESSILSKLLAEESTFQKRISEIYSLDKGLRHETNSITSLHQDKEMLEYTLSGMRNKILDHQDRPSELQKLKKQQKMIEKELIRVKRLLSTSAKKIEDAASKNDQMEKDILHLRQILKEALKTGSCEMKDSQHNRADIEAELSRVQNVLDELANHRHEINNTVMKLKGEAPPSATMGTEFRASPSGTTSKETLLLKIKKEPELSTSPPTVTEEKDPVHLKKVKKGVEVRASPTGVAGSAPLPVRKKQHSMYLETDLDTMTTRDLASVHEKDLDDIPVYVNAEEINNPSEEIYENLSTLDYSNAPQIFQSDGLNTEQCSMQDINDADERMKRFYGIIPKEKPSEIKTVRIVKRQSERRNRERDKKRVTYDDQSSVWVVEEPDLSSSDDLLDVDEGITNRNSSPAARPSSIHLLTSSLNRPSNSQSAHERLFGSSATKIEKSVSSGNQDRSYPSKRSKRRHYTVSGYQYVLDPQFSQYFKDQPRSRDDVDMERCLRTANTPDIVRSTIKKNDVFDDKIIERELMLPQKIEIPERYVEIEPEQLSASERLRRSIKAENICKMLSETTTTYEDVEERSKSPEALHKKLSEEKRKRAHLLNLNRAIAREVVEKSKAVAANICSAENQAAP